MYLLFYSCHALCNLDQRLLRGSTWIVITKKVKVSRNRPAVAQRFPVVLGSQISWHSAHEGGEVVSLTHRPPLPPRMFLVLIFTRGWVDPGAMVWLEENMSLKNPVTPPGIDPGTFRLVAQRLNHYATPGPILHWREQKYEESNFSLLALIQNNCRQTNRTEQVPRQFYNVVCSDRKFREYYRMSFKEFSQLLT
jgi:hypothetical protein